MGAIDWSQIKGGQPSTGGGAIDWSAVNSAPGATTAAPAAPVAEKQQPGMLASFGAGLGHGFGSMMLGAQQFAGKGAQAIGMNKVGDWLANDAKQGLDKIDAEYAPYKEAHSIVAGTGDVAGQIAPLVMSDGLLGAPARGAQTLTAKMLPQATPKIIQSLAPTITAGAAGGATASLANPVRGEGDYWQEKADQLKTGAAFGAAAAPVAAGIGRVMSPNGPSAEVKQLMDAGVTPTPGQMAGGWVNTAEQKLSSMPVVGNLINAARGRAVNDFNVAVANRALAPIGATVPKDIQAGSDLVEHVADKIGSVYDSVQPAARFAADPAFGTAVADIRTQLAQTAPAKLDQFENILKNQITGKLNNGVMDGEQWGNTRSMLGQFVRQNSAGNATVDERALASAVGDLRDAVNGAVYRASPAEVQPTIEKANSAWAQYKQMERAAGTVGAFNRGNVFSPAQYTAAVRKDLSAGQRGQGKGLNTDFAQNAQQVLGNTVPDSGTAGRLGEAGLLGAAVAHPSALLNPSLYAAALPALAYTKTGQALMAAAMQARPGMAPAASVMRRTGTMAAGLLGSGQDHPQMQNEDPYLLGE